MQHFLENTIQSRFIQSYLYNNPIPNFDTVSDGDTIIEGMQYANRRQIIKCTKTGTYMHTGKHERIREYDIAYYYPKFSKRYVPKSAYYDTDTHIWLGEYLRIYRDIYGVNLMPYYNMFAEDWLSSCFIDAEDNEIKTYSKSSVKLTRIPIKFNKTYTIAIDSPSTIMLAPAFFMKDYLLTIKDVNSGATKNLTSTFISSRLTDNFSDIKKYPNLSFSHPITYRVDCIDFEYAQYQRDLYLLIQLPYECTSSIVVLEGDYTDFNNAEQIINYEEIDNKISSNNLNSTLKSELSLLQLNTGASYPYTDRLIEYLLNNVIDSEENISGNIQNTQLSVPYLRQSKYFSGAWNDYTRAKIYKYVMESKKVKHLDINGFVDKDTEKAIGMYTT